MPYTLYTCAHSRGLRVSWTATELGLDLEYRMLPFPPRRAAEGYRDINPLGTVPAMPVGDTVMTESTAICHFLAQQHGGGALMIAPDEPDYAPFLDYLYHADATITFPQTVYMRFAMFERERGLEAAGEAYAEWFGARLAKVEARLEGREFLVGDRFTIADVAVGYALYLSRVVKLEQHLGPRARDYLDRLVTRPGFKEAARRETEAAKAQGVA